MVYYCAEKTDLLGICKEHVTHYRCTPSGINRQCERDDIAKQCERDDIAKYCRLIPDGVHR